MKKTERFAFNMTIEDKRALTQLADEEGEQLAVVLRRLIRLAAASRKAEQPISKTPCLDNKGFSRTTREGGGATDGANA